MRRWLGLLRLVLSLVSVLVVAPSWANIYYTDSNASDNSCIPNSPGTPRSTIQGGMSCLSPGDTLYLRQGTYNERIYPGNFHIPSGTGWGANQVITIAGYPGETATLTQGVALQGNFDGSMPAWLIFDHLTIQNTGDSAFTMGATTHDIRISQSDLQTFGSSGSMNIIVFASGTSNMQAIGNVVHDAPIGLDFGDVTGHYGFYINGDGMLIDGNTIRNNTGYAIHLYHQGGFVQNTIIRNNIMYGNCFDDGSRNQALGVVVLQGTNNLMYNNLLYDNACVGSGPGIAVSPGTGGDGNKVYNNTITRNHNGPGIYLNAGLTNTQVRNNIVWDNNGTIQDDGGGCCGTVLATNLTTDPQFVGSGATPLRPQSPNALDQGTCLGAVPVDIDGVARPQPTGGACDIGAYEGSGGGVVITPGPQALTWKLDNVLGGTTPDATGNGYAGTLTGGPGVVAGRQGSGALTFNGSSQYVTNAGFVWGANQPVTVLFWNNVATCTAGGAFGAYNASVADRFGAHAPYSNCNLYWDYGDFNTTGRVFTDYTTYLGRWVRVALVSAGAGGAFQAIYLNGTRVAFNNVSGAPTVNLAGMDLGRWPQESTPLYTTGSLDDFRLDNRVWSAAEIQSDYRQAAGSKRHRIVLR